MYFGSMRNNVLLGLKRIQAKYLIFVHTFKRNSMFDIMSMMTKVKEAQVKLKAAQQELKFLRAEGEAGAGLVRVVVNGERQVVDMEIDSSLVNPSDQEMMKDLIVAATNFALQAVEVKIKDKMKSATEGIAPNIPGMDLGGLF